MLGWYLVVCLGDVYLLDGFSEQQYGVSMSSVESKGTS